MAIGENIKNQFLLVPYDLNEENVDRDTLYFGNLYRTII